MTKIISISGLIASGKDSIASYLIAKYGFKKASFADSLKDSISCIFGWDRTLLAGDTAESRIWRETVDTWWEKKLSMPGLTPRIVLQKVGTDILRNRFHTDIWVASLEHKLKDGQDNIVITDCRFGNEFVAIKNAGGITIRIHRGPDPVWYNDAVEHNKGPDYNPRWATGAQVLKNHKVHPSEYSSVGLPYDHHIYNDGTLDDLYNTIDSILVNG